jgi:penicillin-insensitive murein endopeptidase
MEGSRKKGGKTLIHRTHQSGLSVDFMVPKKKEKKKGSVFDRMGMWHYLLEFSDIGSLDLHKNIVIDFETMGRHILALDDAARNNGLRIKKVILKIELKDDFFNTPSSKKVKQREIYFAKALTPMINRVHDDHYHVDFEII